MDYKRRPCAFLPRRFNFLRIIPAKVQLLIQVFANADTSKGYKGITCFLVDRSQEGVSVEKKEDKLGIRASSTCPVYFDHVRVPKSSILGEYGKGENLIRFGVLGR